jgi:hypothetical protein
LINAVNRVHALRPDNAAGAPAELPPEVAIGALDPAHAARRIAQHLDAHLRVDVTGADGTVRQIWVDPYGGMYRFDPVQTRPDPFNAGAVWVDDPVSSRTVYFSAAVAERNELLTSDQRALADTYGLGYVDLGRLYRRARGQTFEQAFTTEIAARRGRLAAQDPILPQLLGRAADSLTFWEREASLAQGPQNAEDPVGPRRDLSGRERQARWNEEDARRILRYLQETAAGTAVSRAGSEEDVRALITRLDAMAADRAELDEEKMTAPAPRISDPAMPPGDPASGEAAPASDGLSGAQVAALARMELSAVDVLAVDDAVVHALLGAIPAEYISTIGGGQPPTPAELRTHFANVMTADLVLDPGQRRFWPLLDGVVETRVPVAAAPGPVGDDGSADDRRRSLVTALTAPGGGADTDELLLLAAAGVVLGLQIIVVAPDGGTVAFGPESGPRVVLVRAAEPRPYVAPWAATAPVAAGPIAPAAGSAAPHGTETPLVTAASPTPPPAPAPLRPSARRPGGHRGPTANLDPDPFAGR